MPKKNFTFIYEQYVGGTADVTPLNQVVDGNAIYVPNAPVDSKTIPAGGSFTLSIPVPTTGEYGYRFRLQKTGLDTLIFDRGISDSSPLIGAQLVDTFFSQDLLENSIFAIARALITDPQFLAAVPGFTERTWGSATSFAAGEYTWRGDGLYRAIVAHSNKDPLIAANVAANPASPGTAVWEKKMTIPTGAGTTTTDVAWNFGTFTGRKTEPASRDNLASAIAAVGTPDLSNYAVRSLAANWTGKQNFGAGASGVTAAAGTNNTDLATHEFVQAALGTSSAISQQLLVRGNRFNLGNLSMGSGDSVIVDYGNFTANVDGWHSGTSFRVPSGRSGDYEFEVGLDLGFNTATLNAAFRVVMREFTGTNPDQNFTDVILILAGQPYNTGELGGVFRFSYPCVGGRNYAIRATALVVSGSGARTVRSSSYNRLSIWRR